jgi:hypothetical protein
VTNAMVSIKKLTRIEIYPSTKRPKLRSVQQPDVHVPTQSLGGATNAIRTVAIRTAIMRPTASVIF